MLGLDRYGFHKKCAGTRYTEFVFLHLVGSAGPVVYSGAPGARNVNTLFSCSDGPGAVSTKSVLGHVTLNLCFCIHWDLRVT
jgi:hypothetical protein